VEKNKFCHCRIVTSSYLPDWRPGSNYAGLYSASAAKGGGAILDLSHEIDYVKYIFGNISDMNGAYGKVSNLQIDAEDFSDMIIKCPKAIINLHLNFFSKNLERKIVIDFSDSSYLEGDLINNRLSVYSANKIKHYRYSTSRNEVYLRQLAYFFKNINNKKIMNNLIEAGSLFEKILTFKKTYGK
jgi:predicted dehydrogenase